MGEVVVVVVVVESFDCFGICLAVVWSSITGLT